MISLGKSIIKEKFNIYDVNLKDINNIETRIPPFILVSVVLIIKSLLDRLLSIQWEWIARL